MREITGTYRISNGARVTEAEGRYNFDCPKRRKFYLKMAFDLVALCAIILVCFQ